MSERALLDKITLDGMTLETGEVLSIERQFAHIPAGTAVRVERLYEVENDVFAYIRGTECEVGANSEYDGPALAVCRALNKGKLSFGRSDQSHN